MKLLSRDGRLAGAPKRASGNAGRVIRLAAIAIVVVVAGLVIGAASRPHSVEFSFSAPQLGGIAVLAVLVLAAAVGLLIGANPSAVGQLPPPDMPQPGRKSRLPWEVRLLLVLVPIMVVAFALASAKRASDEGRQPPGVAPGQTVAVPDVASSGGAELVLVAVAVGLAGFLVAAVLLKRPAATATVRPVSEAPAAAILDEGLDALLAEADPRAAVIGSYVAMERAMARKGLARRPHEAPTEHLRRVLGIAPGRAEDLEELVDLYELARFSEHSVTSAMRDAAVDSVKRLRAELQGRA